MKKYKLTNELTLTEIGEVEQKVNTQNLHDIKIFDRSGSMYNLLPKVIDDLKQQIRQLEVNDAFSLGWFSGHGQFDFPVRLFRIVGEESYEELDRLLDKCKTTIGMTCFSEVLADAEKVINGASFLNMKTSIQFFTDGWANSPSISSEHKKTKEIMEILKDKVDFFLAISYGNYADFEFLTELSEIAGGESVSPDNLESFSKLTNKFLRGSKMGYTKKFTDLTSFLDKDVVNIFSISPDIINSYKLGNGNVAISGKGYMILNEDNDLEIAPIDVQYASALVLSRRGSVDMALDVLNQLGDKYLIDKLNNSFTPSERGAVEDEIKDAIFSESSRFLNGTVVNYLPDPNQFCLLDLVDLLANDKEAKFYPKHPDFKYNSIGRRAVQKDGYEKFNAYLENSCPISNFTWNKEFLNLSMLATIKGTVKLKDRIELKEVFNCLDGNTPMPERVSIINKPSTLGDIKETFQWRNYTLIKDGFLNITKLPISASIKTLQILFNKGLITQLYPEQVKNVFVLDLTSIPVINRQVVIDDISASNLLARVYQENLIQAKIKVLNSLRKEIAPDAPKIQNNWTDEEREFLLASGFREDGSYSPPSEKEESIDHYDAVAFKTTIKGFTSLPSLKDVKSRVDAIKSAEEKGGKLPKLTPSMIPMVESLYDFTKKTDSLNNDEKIEVIDSELRDANFVLNKIRTKIQKQKFGLIIGKKWFSDLDKAEAEQAVKFNPIASNEELTGVIQVFRKEVEI